MNKLNLAAMVIIGVSAFGMAPVQAGTTCKVIPSMCPPAPGGGDGTSVPEPATLAVLAVGACAAGLAARRRRK